jgi:hypothetical protein
MRFRALFKAPAGVAVSIAALGLSVWLLAHISGEEAKNTAYAAAIGLLIYGAYRLFKRKLDVEKVIQSTRD